MADVKDTVKKMVDQGMGADEIKANLNELGFANADAIVQEALAAKQQPAMPQKATQPAQAQQPAKPQSEEELGFSMTSIGAEGDEKELKFESAGDGGTLFSEKKELNTGRIEEKLDDAIALLKAIQDLNKKLLKANQDLAAKIK